MSRRVAIFVVAVLIVGLVPIDSAAAPLAAVPATVRVNISGLGVKYARIGSLTGVLTVTRPGGGLVYQGYLSTLIRTEVKRLANPGGRAAKLPLEVSPDERAGLRQDVRDARLGGLVDAVPLVTVPFEFAIEQPGADPLGPALIAAQEMIPLHFETSDGMLNFNGRIYRGTFDLTKDDDGDMILVNEVDTARYLASVVGSEEPTTWMPQALAAQAIAARTYLVTHLGRHDAYDLEGDTRDQEYDGFGGETDSTLRAVERTAGLVATYRGRPIEALYSANAGGFTEDSENVFPNALPYLRAVRSPGDEEAGRSTWGRTSWQWTQEYTEPELRAYLAVRGINVGRLERIEIAGKTGAGRVTAARIVGSERTRELTKDVTRYYFGLRSTMFDVTLRPAETELVTVLGSERSRQLELLGARLLGAVRGSVRDPDNLQPYRIIAWRYAVPPRFVFTGRGFGHGVGMSQWGAQGMALAGASYEEILKHYYTGISLTNIGGA